MKEACSMPAGRSSMRRLLARTRIELVVQVNGKMRGKLRCRATSRRMQRSQSR